MKLFDIKLCGYFGKILIDELPTKSVLYEIANQINAEAINYSNFNKIGVFHGFKTDLDVEYFREK